MTNRSLLAFVIILTATTWNFALSPSALEEIARSRENNIFRLQIDLHEPDTRADSMQIATLESGGWHHHNPSGAVVLRAGTSVKVIGLFNYADKGLVLELAQEDPSQGKHEESGQQRVRIRILVNAPATDGAQQIAEATSMIDKILAAPDVP